jgi:large subunit ribosomal protein L3
MSFTLLGSKLGMTRTFTDEGKAIPVTVIQAGPCIVTQVKTVENDGYSAVQIGFGDMKARNSTMPMIGHDGKAGCDPKRHHREFRVDAKDLGEFTPGQTLSVDRLAQCAFVDVTGTSKGKGTAGVMKRHNFKGMFASHGCERMHRHGGSIGSHASWRGNGQIAKGKRMGGRMGNERVTVRSLEVVSVDPEKNLILVKGPVPGPNQGLVEIRIPTRLYKSKATKQAEKAKG